MLKQFFDSDVIVRFDNAKSETSIYFDDTICKPSFTLDSEKMLEFNSLLDKYFEWNKKATEKGVKIEKEIGRFTTNCYFKYGDEWYGPSTAEVVLTFFSRSENQHELVVEITKLYSPTNNYITCAPSAQYFIFKSVKILRKFNSIDFIQKKVKENDKQKSIESEFK